MILAAELVKFRLIPSKVRLASPWIALAPVTVVIVLLVDPVNAVPAEIPVRFQPPP